MHRASVSRVGVVLISWRLNGETPRMAGPPTTPEMQDYYVSHLSGHPIRRMHCVIRFWSVTLWWCRMRGSRRGSWQCCITDGRLQPQPAHWWPYAAPSNIPHCVRRSKQGAITIALILPQVENTAGSGSLRLLLIPARSSDRPTVAPLGHLIPDLVNLIIKSLCRGT